METNTYRAINEKHPNGQAIEVDSAEALDKALRQAHKILMNKRNPDPSGVTTFSVKEIDKESGRELDSFVMAATNEGVYRAD